MTNILSKIPFDHHLHEWTSSCSEASVELFLVTFYQCLRIYGPINLIQALWTQRSFELWPAFKEIVRFCTFVSLMAFLSSSAVCFSSHMNQASSHASIFKSRLTLYASLMSAIAMVVPLETQSNLNAAAILLVKAAVEAIWKLVLNQKADLVQSGNPVKPFAILSFAAALSLSMALIKQDGHGKDPLSNVLKTIIGSSEGRPHADEIQPCPHKSFCRFYAMFGFIRSFTIGYIFMFSLSSTRHPIRAIKSNYRLLGSRKSLKFAIFLGTLSAIFKGAMCYQRNANWDLPVKTDPRYQAAISGFLAGLSSIIFPSNQLSSYMIWKTLFSFYRSRVTNRHTGHEASSSRVSRSLMVNLVFIMSASTVLMFYSTRPELLPKSYVRTIENIVPRRYFGQL